MTFSPMPAKPKPMTSSATQNIHPWLAKPQVMSAHGTKYNPKAAAAFRCKRQSPLRLRLFSLK